MNKRDNFLAKVIKTAVEKTLTADANRTSCAVVYQPKAPTKLEQFKKSTNHDK